MRRFIARQAIYSPRGVLFGYELLARLGPENRFEHPDGDLASCEMIDDVLGIFDLEALTDHRLAFINVTASVLRSELVRRLPPQGVVLEVLESVAPTPDVIAACRSLKRAGYRIALDDYSPCSELEPLLALADIVKIDFRCTPALDRAWLAGRLGGRAITLVAEKVETCAEYREAAELGYSLIQGHFLSRPEMLSAEEPAMVRRPTRGDRSTVGL